MRECDLTKQTDTLKKLISEHPDYPIAILAGEEANSGDYCWMFCSYVSFEVGEMLATDYYGYNDEIITNRDELEELIEDRLYDNKLSDDELEKAVKEEIAKLEPYWKKVIFIYANN